jgi:tRNA wybutosine-synthesizing protein 1
MDFTPVAQVLFAATTVASAALGYLYLTGENDSADKTPALPSRTTRETAAAAVRAPEMLQIKVLYASQTGTARSFAEILRKEAFAMNVSGFHLAVTAQDLATYDIDAIEKESLIVLLMPTWEGGVPPPSGRLFYDHLRDMSTDFRVSKAALAKMKYAIFGLGNSYYDENYCRVAMDLDECFQRMGAEALCEVGRGDCSQDMEAQFEDWRQQLWPALCEVFAAQFGVAAQLGAAAESSGCGSCGSPAVDSKSVFRSATTWEEEDVVTALPTSNITGRNKRRQTRTQQSAESGCCNDAEGGSCGCTKSAPGSGKDGAWLPLAEYRRLKRNGELVNKRKPAASSGDSVSVASEAPCEIVEEDLINERLLAEADDVAGFVDSDDEHQAALAVASTKGGEGLADIEDMGAIMSAAAEEKKQGESKEAVREMVTPAQRRALTKEGYKLIGSHSAVKLCRWTKAQLRGRGGCYKHTFYGIQSYQVSAFVGYSCCRRMFKTNFGFAVHGSDAVTGLRQ